MDLVKQHPIMSAVVAFWCIATLLAWLDDKLNALPKIKFRHFLGPEGTVSTLELDKLEHPERYRNIPDSEEFTHLRGHYESFKKQHPAAHFQLMRKHERDAEF